MKAGKSISEQQMKTDRERKSFRWYLLLAVFILFLSYYISNNWYSVMLIQGDSMIPAYHDKQFVILDRHTKKYSYGDVIAFQCDALSSVLVKRIAACPGDEAVIIDGTLYVNGTISTVYSESGCFAFAGELDRRITLDEGEYIVIGDNIAVSKDSRYEMVGCVEENEILGSILKFKK